MVYIIGAVMSIFHPATRFFALLRMTEVGGKRGGEVKLTKHHPVKAD